MNFEFINKFIIITSATKSLLLITIIFYASKIVRLNITNVIIKEYVFRKHRFVRTFDIYFNKIRLRALF